MSVSASELLKALRPRLSELRTNLEERARNPGVEAALRRSHGELKAESRTAAPFEMWMSERAAQIAAAWVLSMIFVRTLEDRGLLDRPRIAGEGAADSEEQFIRLAPFLSPRDYLLTVFKELARLPGASHVFDARHNPVWTLGPDGHVARELIDFFREQEDTGELRFRFDGTDTRFLGDLYQDLFEEIREQYALLQTPDFIEEFILDETLDPAIQEFGLEAVRLIDPTCGSGHFLLGTYARLYRRWAEKEPATDPALLAQRALEQVAGADINPYAVAIARFRLTLAFMDRAGITSLTKVPELKIRVCVADSLLVAAGEGELGELAPAQDRGLWGIGGFVFEDAQLGIDILGRRYHAVVGNPPYITIKDKALRDRYRNHYEACYREYQLVVPFLERFFRQATDGGFVGAIVGNGFMKREFGRKLIEEVLERVDLRRVVDTSGAYIPGHGTPTVILFGRNAPRGEGAVPTVQGIRGEPSTPEDAADGHVWSSIRDHHADIGFENEYVSVAAVPRERFDKHPWSLGGGGASELREWLEGLGSATLGEVADSIGFGAITGEDNVMLLEQGVFGRQRVSHCRPNVHGEVVRDWSLEPALEVLWPNNDSGDRLSEGEIHDVLKFLWPYRRVLQGRKAFGVPIDERGIPWWAIREVYRDRFRTPLSIAFAFVATHNHFVLDRGGKVFNRSAPIIKLPEGSTEDDHLVLLAYLSSSTACFWMKQVSHDKGSGTDQGKWQAEKAKIAYEFTGTQLEKMGIPGPVARGDVRRQLVGIARELDELGSRRASILLTTFSPDLAVENVDTVRSLARRIESEDRRLLQRMILLQEQLDWAIYRAVGVTTAAVPMLPADAILPLGARPFEVLAARAGSEHGIDGQHLNKQTEGLDPLIAKAVEEWMHAITESAQLRLLEDPKYKRRWLVTPKHLAGRVETFEDRVVEHLQTWTAERLEALVRELASATPVTESRVLAAAMQQDTLASVAMYLARGDQDPRGVLREILEGEAVPYLSCCCLKDGGMKKLALWERVWDLQRREDAGETLEIPVPPRFASSDYRSPRYWELRGKLDVPKERFISYPGAELDDDPSPVIGWAGWDHLERATALASLYVNRKDEHGWEAERLKPLLAGLLELVPWLKQWHNEPDTKYGGGAGDYFARFVETEAQDLKLSLDDLRLREPARQTGRRKATSRSGRGGRSRAKLEAGVVLEAVGAADGGDGVDLATLAEQCGVGKGIVSKVAAALVEDGKLVETSKRPKRFALAEGARS